MLTNSVQIKVIAVIQRCCFTVDVEPISTDLVLLVERRVVRTQEPVILHL
jgi:hypothetical protein